MPSEIRTVPFDPWNEIRCHQQRMQQQGKYGATTSFVGSMRDFNQGIDVRAMTLEYYPGMTDRYLERICQYTHQQWKLIDTLLIHRVGDIEISEPIILVCVWAAHRAEAFKACQFIVEDLKHKAPFWKQESTAEGKRWLSANTPP